MVSHPTWNRETAGSNPALQKNLWGRGDNGNTSVLHSEVEGSIPSASKVFADGGRGRPRWRIPIKAGFESQIR